MRYRILIVFTILVLLLSACGSSGSDQDLANRVATMMAEANIATMQTTSGPIAPSQTPPPISTIQQTSAPAPDARITITGFQESAPGRGIITWDAVGVFPYGFNVVWTTETRIPELPGDQYAYTGNPDARSAMISGSVGQVILVRVCRVAGGSCDVYSDVGIFAFTANAPTLTPQATAVFTIVPPSPGGGGGGVTLTPAPTIVITGVSGGGNGKAHMTWTSTVTPKKGFAILYSTSDKEPTWEKNAYFIVNDGAAREAYVDGKAGKTYYYRICTLKEGKCDLYSPAVTFTFP